MTDKSIDKREESLRVFNQAAKIYDRVGPGSFSYFGQYLVDLADMRFGRQSARRGGWERRVVVSRGREGRANWPCHRYRLFSGHGARDS